MLVKGRTVLLLVALAIVGSSLATMLFASSADGGMSLPALDQVADRQGAGQPQHSSVTPDVEEQFNKIIEAYEIIRGNYVLEVDETKLLEGAIEGMLNTLDDPYSVYMDPETAEQFKSSLQSSFEGIGAEVMMQNGKVTIVAPIRGAPAEKAGLRPNDQILSVNGESLDGIDLQRAVLKIKGPKGTEAVLEVERPGVAEPITITVIRDEIPLHTVYSETIQAEGKTLGLIELTSFAQKTAEDFKTALTELEGQNMDGLIIDVRGNPGGYLDAVREIGKLIVPNEAVITKIQNRDGDKLGVYRSTLKDPKPYPITILVDEGSASASEILAAALQEAGHYKVVGTKSFGKGTVQSSVELKDSSEIKITIAKWLTPDENWVHGEGVQPDIVVERPEYFSATPIQTEEELTLNMNDNNVKSLQIMLKGLGYDPGRTDGYFDEQTQQAVQQYQTANQLTSTGSVNEETAQLIQEQLIEQMRDPQHDVQLKKAVETLLEEMN
ncbi:S41 family peptidase [Bacillus horti]|uniref:Carboxyl-terminal processing protease n=1 Tax=Caldalkalibacillus horti TaxID=77523 RepID=A0ABT9VZ93_9BACI|nr:S41 family peptidase [Bacillus horti]MDQ0166314.1 carboxyl-terminal processing protease [Bacillus horti]